MISRSKIAAVLVLIFCGPGLAQDVNVCDQPGEAPDLVVSDIVETRRFLFRLEGGKLEQIGQSWAAHRFVALSGTVCSGNDSSGALRGGLACP